MKNSFILMVLALFCASASAEIPPAVMQALASAGISPTNVAIFVQAVDESTPALTINAEKSMNPASVMKLVTTYAALEKLGPAYRWKTELYRDGPIKHGILQGNLIIKGYGDPDFRAHHLLQMLIQLKQLGVHHIKGDLIIDKTYFSPQQVSPPFDEEVWRAYNAPPSAMVVDGRKTSLQFYVQDKQVHVHQEFPLPQVRVEQSLSLREGECDDWRNYIDYRVIPEKQQVKIKFTGSYAVSCDSRYLELSVLNDEQYVFQTFNVLWKALGGSTRGHYKVRAMPEQAEKLLVHWSAPLSEQVRDINKWSNNLMARQLLLTLAAEDAPLLANEQHGAEVIKQQLAQLGVLANALVLENGSGLSRWERLSASELGGMLVKAFQRPVMPEFMASLPILGLDGTVKHRMQNSVLQAKAHLKTGSINGVISIAGYVLAENQRRYAMVMLVNDVNAAEARPVQDALLSWIYQH